MSRPEEVATNISDKTGNIPAGRQVNTTLAPLEFDEQPPEEIVPVDHKLALTIGKHAGQGTITLKSGIYLERKRIESTARDSGNHDHPGELQNAPDQYIEATVLDVGGPIDD